MVCSVVVLGGGVLSSPCSAVEQVTAVVIWGGTVVIAVDSEVVPITVVVTGAVVVGRAVVVIAAGSTAFSSFLIPLQAPAAHSTAMQATTAPVARHAFLFFVIINPSVLVVVVVLRTTHNTTERRDMSIKKSDILPVALKWYIMIVRMQ